jgi:hypothetical protein
MHCTPFIFARKNSHIPVGRSFPFDYTRPTDEFFPTPIHRICFSFPTKAFSDFTASFFIAFGRRVFGRTVRTDCFFFCTYGSSGAKKRAHEAYFSGLNEPPRRTAHVKLIYFLFRAFTQFLHSIKFSYRISHQYI